MSVAIFICIVAEDVLVRTVASVDLNLNSGSFTN